MGKLNKQMSIKLDFRITNCNYRHLESCVSTIIYIDQRQSLLCHRFTQITEFFVQLHLLFH